MDKKGLWIKKDPSKTPGGFFWKKAFSKKIVQNLEKPKQGVQCRIL